MKCVSRTIDEKYILSWIFFEKVGDEFGNVSFSFFHNSRREAAMQCKIIKWFYHDIIIFRCMKCSSFIVLRNIEDSSSIIHEHFSHIIWISHSFFYFFEFSLFIYFQILRTYSFCENMASIWSFKFHVNFPLISYECFSLLFCHKMSCFSYLMELFDISNFSNFRITRKGFYFSSRNLKSIMSQSFRNIEPLWFTNAFNSISHRIILPYFF